MLEFIIKKLDFQIKVNIMSRIDAMKSQLKYLHGKADSKLLFILKKGWSYERLEILIELNSLFQIFIGPFSSCNSFSSKCSLMNKIPILYGDNLLFDKAYRGNINNIERDFLEILTKLKIPPKWLHSNNTNDLIFIMFSELQDDDRPVDTSS